LYNLFSFISTKLNASCTKNVAQFYVVMLQTVNEVVFNFWFRSSLKSSTDCWQTELQIQQDTWGSVHIACVYENYPKVIEEEHNN